MASLPKETKMKSLDEVIYAYELCDSDEGGCEGCAYCAYCAESPFIGALQKRKDAIHYLKEYRDRKETLRNWTEKAISEQQNLSDAITFMRAYLDDKDDLTALRAYWKEQHENNALTWDELKRMVGKPVYVECEVFPSRWFLIEEIGANDSMICIGKFAERIPLHLETMGTMWNAYRKERE